MWANQSVGRADYFQRSCRQVQVKNSLQSIIKGKNWFEPETACRFSGSREINCYSQNAQIGLTGSENDLYEIKAIIVIPLHNMYHQDCTADILSNVCNARIVNAKLYLTSQNVVVKKHLKLHSTARHRFNSVVRRLICQLIDSLSLSINM